MTKFSILFCFCLFGCTPKVINFLNQDAPIGAFSTYGVVNTKINKEKLSDEGKQTYNTIENLIKSEMERRAYILNKQPDALIRYELISNLESTSRNPGMPYYGNSYSYFPNSTNFNVPSRVIQETTLMIELIQYSTKKTVWQASIDLNQYSKSHKKEEILADAVTTIFDTYLYRAKSNQIDPSLKSSK